MNTKNDEVLAQVKEIIAEVLRKEVNEIGDESRLIEDLGAESIDIMTLLIEFEDKFDQQIPDEVAMNLKSVKDIVTYITENS